jgi:hypothetical protein
VPVTGWRRPAFAPVYALTTAFALVAGIGLLAPKPTLVVRLDETGPDTTVEILEGSGKPVDADVRVEAVKVGRVSIVFDGEPPEPAKVSLRDETSEEIAERSATGYYQPRRSLEGQMVCVEPPRGWIVQTQGLDKRGDARCTPAAVTEPADDIEFRLAEGSLR